MKKNYMLLFTAHHLHSAGMKEKLFVLLTSPKFIELKNDAGLIDTYIHDCDQFLELCVEPMSSEDVGNEEKTVTQFKNAIQASLSILRVNSEQLKTQLHARLNYSGTEKTSEVLAGLKDRPNCFTVLHRGFPQAIGPYAFSLLGHRGRITGVDISEKGEMAVTSSEDATIKIWDLTKRNEIATLIGHRARVNDVVLSYDASLSRYYFKLVQ